MIQSDGACDITGGDIICQGVQGRQRHHFPEPRSRAWPDSYFRRHGEPGQ